MDHEGARRLMAEAMEGRLSGDDERELALHLVGCDECKTVYEGLQHANPALTSIQLGEPSTESLDAAVHRATTVLQGEADPGPMGLSDEAPGLPDDLDPNTVRIDSGGPVHDHDLQPAGPLIATGPMTPPSGAVRPLSPPEAHVRAIVEEPVVPEPVFEEPVVVPPREIEREPELPPLVVDLPDDEPSPSEGFEAPLMTDIPVAAAPIPEQPRSEIETLLEQDRSRYDTPVYEDDRDDDDRPKAGPWLIAMAVTVIVAILAFFVISRGPGLFGGSGGDLPSADEVRNRVARTFTDMKSLKTSFDIQKLSLYRLGREENSITYTFSNGRWRGSIDYDRSEGYKQDFTLNVGSNEVSRAEIVQKTDETRSLTGRGASQSFIVEKNPPLGPPDGALRPALGLLEDSLSSAAALIATAEDLEVLRQTKSEDGRQLFEVRLSVPPNELTRADQIEAALDATNFMPVIVRRSISRANARVLGPASALTEANLDTAFGNKERLPTELVTLDNVQYDEIVLPGDLALEPPDGVEEQTRDSKFERVTRAELGSKLDFEPLLPRSLGDYEEQLFATYTGENQKWGPNNALPASQSVFQSQYFDGKTTIVLTQRRQETKFNLTGSPLQRTGLPITVKPVERDGKSFFYGTSPEVAPHVYGFVGNTFVMASGYATQAELVRLVASLTETPVDIQAPLVSGSPSASGSPGASATSSPTPTSSPSGTTAPIVTASP
jgi:hypothetical protein